MALPITSTDLIMQAVLFQKSTVEYMSHDNIFFSET